MRAEQLGRRAAATLGRRGLLLFTMGILYICIGISELTYPPETVADAYHLAIPAWIRGIAWIVSGLIATVFAWRMVPPVHRLFRADRWTDGDVAGWTALYLMPFIRGTSYAGSFLCWLVGRVANAVGIEDPGPWFSGGEPRSLLAAAVWGIVLMVILVCAGWQENEDGPPTPQEGHR